MSSKFGYYWLRHGLQGMLLYGALMACQNSSRLDPSAGHIIPSFQRITIDTVFRSESVTAGDMNRDGINDIVIGDVWYQAPNWEMHEIRPPGEYINTITQENKPPSEYNYYSRSFAVQVLDVNNDGWEDAVIYPVMNQPVYWYENPQGVNVHWQQRIAVTAYHGESPQLVDLWNRGSEGALMGVNVHDSLYHLCWVSPGAHPDSLWDIYTIGSIDHKALPAPSWDSKNKWYAPGARDHGLGFGDLNNDGRKDVLTSRGWYEAPADPEKSWRLHYRAFDSLADPQYPQYVFAQMPIFDVDGDGDRDFVGSSAHRYGLWWFEQQGPDFIKHEIPLKSSQLHALIQGDLNQNGIPDLVTGKRYLAHTGNDPGWDEPLVIYWLEARSDAESGIDFLIEEIDVGVGVGTQIELIDMNGDGKEDLLTSNKKGTYLFLQK